ncbi:MAG: hypothetical protein ACF8TS_19255 [Maioricimonas sp. JB049]
MQPRVMIGLCLVSVGILAPVWGFVTTFRMLVGTIQGANGEGGGPVPAVLAEEMQRSLLLAFGLLLGGVIVGLVGLGLALSGLKGEGESGEAADGGGNPRA